jgi:GMP synthase-like glutamine amidotransferase
MRQQSQKQIGIVNMYGTEYKCHYLVNAIRSIGYLPHIIEGYHSGEAYVFDTIQKSPIKFWIFSGSPHTVTDPKSTQVPFDILTLPNKQFMLLCYSMESLLIQLNYPITKRRSDKKEIFHLTVPLAYRTNSLFQSITNPMVVRRHHVCYFPERTITEPVNLIASYNGEAMIATYKNILLVQFHPEKSVDGKRFIHNWLTA